ncbi:HNH endonuclease [Cupriavidus sp. UYPR2.512]|uniref:HNH endonuclease n=1 Tax=Cupriavidus sp. UYPR2.512 TaxID=1080187 RepID=UPI00035D72B1|nr:HNH endonuclease [Cupriavidus sp. UYPR2.512]UIF88920.1 HNH endonuclease [Cupriavidus necator]
MKRLNPPTFTAAKAVEACASGISIVERAQALRDAVPVIVASEAQYQELGPLGQLFSMEQSEQVTEAINAELMGVIYKSHFARGGSPSRPLYEQIRMAPEHGLCPLCGQRVVATVDHYLPQSRYPKLNLTPVNLVPACSDCNKRKLASAPAQAEEQTLHPYFDNLGDERWLVAAIEASTPPTVSFFVQASSEWDAVLTARVRRHFEVMGLAPLYAAQAASEMADISYALEEVGQAAGPTGIRAHLDAQFRSRHARDRNSWKTALYEGLRDSAWFCGEGYHLIRHRVV